MVSELKPLLSILHRDAALTFDSNSLLPMGLTRGLAEETLDDLSGGTREQIAILTRLAFARLFARQGRHMPIVLDDASNFFGPMASGKKLNASPLNTLFHIY